MTIPRATRHFHVLELRQYTLHPGMRETLIDLFEREFVEPQRELGIALPGLFRDADNPDRFVWCRAFPTWDARPQMLASFYDGPVWHANRLAANATMVDSDNVLILRPLDQPSAHLPDTTATSRKTAPTGVVVAMLHALAVQPDCDAVYARLCNKITPLLRAGGGALLGAYGSEPRPNNYPRLPVREGEHVLAWFARFPDFDAHSQVRDALAAASQLALDTPATVIRLQPTRRSAWPDQSGETRHD